MKFVKTLFVSFCTLGFLVSVEGINWKSRLMRSLQDYYPHPTDPFCSGFTNCPSKCYGDNGCDCDVPDGRDGDPHCLLCESPKYGGLGCTECDIENGYFKVDYNYPCKQCEEVFGEGCLHCGDFNGCEECDLQYYDRIFDPDCKVYYCRKKTCGTLPTPQDPLREPLSRDETNEENSENSESKCSISDSNIRLLFAGGYPDPFDNDNSNDICYSYKLTLHNNSFDGDGFRCGINILNNSNGNGFVWSLSICDSNNYKLDDFISGVKLLNNENDYYWTDDNNFYYYVSNLYDAVTSDNTVDICFDDYFNRNVKLIKQTDYCLNNNNNNNNNICSHRGMYVTDICSNSYSLGRNNIDLPSSDIDYVPIPGKTYYCDEEYSHDDFHGGNLMSGCNGRFSLREDVIVLRTWWIDECKILTNNSNYSDYTLYNNTAASGNYDPDDIDDYMVIIIDDDYLNSSSNIFYYNDNDLTIDIINHPVLLPHYDRYITSLQCEEINGIIFDYIHDISNENLILFVNYQDTNPLNYLGGDSHFNFKNFHMVHLSKQNDDNDDRRRRLGEIEDALDSDEIPWPVDESVWDFLPGWICDLIRIADDAVETVTELSSGDLDRVLNALETVAGDVYSYIKTAVDVFITIGEEIGEFSGSGKSVSTGDLIKFWGELVSIEKAGCTASVTTNIKFGGEMSLNLDSFNFESFEMGFAGIGEINGEGNCDFNNLFNSNATFINEDNYYKLNINTLDRHVGKFVIMLGPIAITFDVSFTLEANAIRSSLNLHGFKSSFNTILTLDFHYGLNSDIELYAIIEPPSISKDYNFDLVISTLDDIANEDGNKNSTCSIISDIGIVNGIEILLKPKITFGVINTNILDFEFLIGTRIMDKLIWSGSDDENECLEYVSIDNSYGLLMEHISLEIPIDFSISTGENSIKMFGVIPIVDIPQLTLTLKEVLALVSSVVDDFETEYSINNLINLYLNTDLSDDYNSAVLLELLLISYECPFDFVTDYFGDKCCKTVNRICDGITNPNCGNTLKKSSYLKENEYLLSTNGKYRLNMQYDGNLCSYYVLNNSNYWCSDTALIGTGPYVLTLIHNTDSANFYNYYKLSIIDSTDAILWSIFKIGSNNEGYFILEDNGNSILYDGNSNDNRNLWNTKGIENDRGTSLLNINDLLLPDEYLSSSNGNYKFQMEVNGNLCLYSMSNINWCSNSYGLNGKLDGYALTLLYNTDNNGIGYYEFVVFDKYGEKLWYNELTNSYNNGYLTVEDDGNVILYDGNGIVLWDIFSVGINRGVTLDINVVLNQNEYLLSSNGKYKLRLRGDGKLETTNISLNRNNYNNETEKSYWVSESDRLGSGPYTLKLMYFNNSKSYNYYELCIFDYFGIKTWSSGELVSYISGGYLVLQDDGNLVIYNDNSESLWNIYAITTHYDKLDLNTQKLYQGEYLLSPNGNNLLRMQGDGNLCGYSFGRTVYWCTNTVGSGSGGPYYLELIFNDNTFYNYYKLTLYDKNNLHIWSTDELFSYNNNGYLIVEDDLNIIVYDGYVNALWNRYTNYDLGSTLGTGVILFEDKYLHNGDHILTMQTDGNACAQTITSTYWCSKSANIGTGPYALTLSYIDIIEDSSNSHNNINAINNYYQLKIVDSTNRIIWHKNRVGMSDNGKFDLASDGNLVLYDGSGRVVWNYHNNRNNMGTNILYMDNLLYENEYLSSPNGNYILLMQPDANLVVRPNNVLTPIWDSESATNKNNEQILLQLSYHYGSDENTAFNYYSIGIYNIIGEKFWSRELISMYDNGFFSMQDDGNAVLYDGEGRSVWNTMFIVSDRGLDYLKINDLLYQNEHLTSSNGKYSLHLASTGELFVYHYLDLNTPTWRNNKASDGAFVLTLKYHEKDIVNDNTYYNWYSLVVMDLNGNVPWSRELISLSDNGFFIIQNDGNGVLYDGEGRAIWNTKNIDSNRNTDRLEISGNSFIYQNEHLTSSDSQYRLGMQDDANLCVRYVTNLINPIWCSASTSNGAFILELTYNSNTNIYKLSVTSLTGSEIWSREKSSSNDNGYAVMQTDGNFVLYDGANNCLWSSDKDPYC